VGVELCRQPDAPMLVFTHVFREARLPGLAVALGLLGLSIAGVVALVKASEEGPLESAVAVVLFGIIALVCGVAALCYGSMARAAFGEANWILRYGPDGVLIKFRSYLNAHFPDDEPTVVWISTQEIDSVRKRTEVHSAPRHDDPSRRMRNVLIDLRLRSLDTDALHEAIEREKRAEPPRSGLVSSKAIHVPVWVPERGVIRLAWRGAGGWITPNADRALEILSRTLRVEDPQGRKTDWRTPRGRDLDAHILELCERGETIDALAIVQRRYGMNLSQARRFIDELAGRS
jgi:hypothetical protein